MVSDQFFQTSKVERNGNTFKFIAVGAFRRNKGFDILVDAFAEGHFPENIKLDIVGDGEERELVERKVHQHGLSSQIHLLGTKTPAEVSELLCNSDCFVLSSRLETFAIVVIEAMAKGLPVIATKSGGPETFLQPEHGILVQKENVEELADAMQYMIEHHLEYNPEDIRKFCYDHFSQNVIADQIIGVYNQVLNNNLN
jgi:glycosyltransferase involved in cell wall biosynthesis